MKVVDANVLLSAYNSDSVHHPRAQAWLDDALSGAATVGFAWMVLLAFVRVGTLSAAMPRPMTIVEAFDQSERWLSSPSARIVGPTARHASIVRQLLVEAGVGGNIVNDAHLAALAVEHRGQVVTFDTDFARFPRVRWELPGVP